MNKHGAQKLAARVVLSRMNANLGGFYDSILMVDTDRLVEGILLRND
jgi:hypothetical protein